jgi:hypothetical protein
MIRLKPIIIERNDEPLAGLWVAYFDNYDGPESPIGGGDTPANAVEALIEAAGIEA